MRKLRAVPAVLAVILFSGCYHATVDTGRPTSGQQVRQPWAHSFLYGLVPPSTVETAGRCPNGVARVETQMSFLNMLANTLTLGLYTPMEITVQCAQPGSALNGAELVVPAQASVEQASNVILQAARTSAHQVAPVYVRFE